MKMASSLPLTPLPTVSASAPARSSSPTRRPPPFWHALVVPLATTGLLLSTHSLVSHLHRPASLALVHALTVAIAGKPFFPALDAAVVPALDAWALALASAAATALTYWALYLVPAHVFAFLLLLEVPLVGLALARIRSSTHASPALPVPNVAFLGLIVGGSLLASLHDLMAMPLSVPVCTLALAASSLAMVLLQSKPALARLSGTHALALTAPKSAAVLFGAVLLIEIPALSQLNLPLVQAVATMPWGVLSLSIVCALVASVCGAAPTNRAYSRATVLGLTEVTLTAMASCMMAQPALKGSQAWTMLTGFLVALGGLFLYSNALTKEANHHDRLNDPLMADDGKHDFAPTHPTLPSPLPVSKFSTTHIAVFASLVGLSLLVGTNSLSAMFHLGEPATVAHPEPEFQWPPLNLPHVQPKHRGKRLPARPAGAKESVAEVMYKLFNADELGLDWNWDWRREQPGAVVNGKKQRVVVMHADTRPLQDLSDVHDDPWAFKHMTMGPLYVMWWAMRHGYDYRRVRLNQPNTKVGGWGKPKVIYDALHRYDWVVFVDSDAYPRRPDLALEDLLERWGFHANASVMLPIDPPEQLPENRNATNNGPGLNTGFWIARSTPTAKAILRDLATCPEHDDCRIWWTKWPAEQAAFSKVVVPKYKQGEDIIVAPCAEANGWWAVKICPGALWHHTWTAKQWAPKNMIERFMIDQIKVWQRLMRASYHSSDECTAWKTGEDERCTFKEDVDAGDGVADL